MTPENVSAPATRDSIVIDRRRPLDQPALERMYAEVFGAEEARLNRERWRWQYEDNPHCPDEGPEIWVAKENGDVLGQYATMPVRLKVRDRIVRASWGMDVMVRPSIQRKGIGSRLFLYWDRQVEASLGLGLSSASYTLFQKLQWEDLGPIPCYTRILDPTRLLARRVGRAPAVVMSPIARLALGAAFPARTSAKSRAPIEIRELATPFGEGFDRLWDRASKGFDFVAERTAAYLEWKYHRAPHVVYEIFEALRGNDVVGFVVLRAAEPSGVRIGLVVDLFAHPEDLDVLDALIDGAAAWGRERQVARLQAFMLDQRIARRLRHKGFFEIGSPMQFCLRIRSEYADESFFRDTSRWHVTFGDSDQDRHG
jgi:GNAT superfamily N-acetyltransferase